MKPRENSIWVNVFVQVGEQIFEDEPLLARSVSCHPKPTVPLKTWIPRSNSVWIANVPRGKHLPGHCEWKICLPSERWARRCRAFSCKVEWPPCAFDRSQAQEEELEKWVTVRCHKLSPGILWVHRPTLKFLLTRNYESLVFEQVRFMGIISNEILQRVKLTSPDVKVSAHGRHPTIKGPALWHCASGLSWSQWQQHAWSDWSPSSPDKTGRRTPAFCRSLGPDRPPDAFRCPAWTSAGVPPPPTGPDGRGTTWRTKGDRRLWALRPTSLKTERDVLTRSLEARPGCLPGLPRPAPSHPRRFRFQTDREPHWGRSTSPRRPAASGGASRPSPYRQCRPRRVHFGSVAVSLPSCVLRHVFQRCPKDSRIPEQNKTNNAAMSEPFTHDTILTPQTQPGQGDFLWWWGKWSKRCLGATGGGCPGSPFSLDFVFSLTSFLLTQR